MSEVLFRLLLICTEESTVIEDGRLVPRICVGVLLFA